MPEPPGELLPPYSLDAEQAVLGCCLLSARALTVVRERCRPEDFYVPVHRRIYQAIQHLAESEQAVDVLTLPELLRTRGELDRDGGIAYVNELADAVPTAAHVEHYVEIVREKSRLRLLIDLSEQAIVAAHRQTETAAEITDRLTQALAGDARGSDAGEAPDLLELVGREVTRMSSGEPTRDRVGLGLPVLDRMIGGLERGDLGIIFGRPGSGKSSLALQALEYWARHWGPALVFTLEMRGHALACRWLACQTGLAYRRLREQLGVDELTQVAEAMQRLEELPHRVLVDDTSAALSQLLSRAERYRAQHRIDVILVDYTQLVVDDTARFGSGGRAQETAQVSRALKRLATTLNLPVWALSGANRDVERRPGDAEGQKALLRTSDLNWSGQIEQDASVIIALNPRGDGAAAEQEVIAGVLKSRNDATGEVPLTFRKAAFQFVARDTQHGDAPPEHHALGLGQEDA